jgi:hypothetical protein
MADPLFRITPRQTVNLVNFKTVTKYTAEKAWSAKYAQKIFKEKCFMVVALFGVLVAKNNFS